MSTPLRVGFIGLHPDRHWAAMAHLPALKSLGDTFEVVGVANSTPESGRETAKALGLAHAFATPAELVASPDVDVVTVTVKVPHHFELVSLALEAGKHVYCEWPLGNGVDEARRLTDLAEAKGVVAVAGTQARTALEIRHLKRLVAGGYVGKVLSTSLVASGGNWADTTSAELAYLYDTRNGATMLEIPLGHTLAAVRDVLGDFEAFRATLARRFETVTITETGEKLPKSAADQILLHGTLTSGAPISVHYRGGTSRGTNFLWEINGTEGDLQVTASLGHAQMAQLTVLGARGSDDELSEEMPPRSTYEGKPGFAGARNVAGLYAALADDIRNGTRLAPSFRDALELHALLDAIQRAAAHPMTSIGS